MDSPKPKVYEELVGFLLLEETGGGGGGGARVGSALGASWPLGS